MNVPSMQHPKTDWARQPLGTVFWWVLPAAIAISAGPLRLPFDIVAAIWAVAFAWMATGCLLNALRCHRLHCYISGPVLFAGAAGAALLASGVAQSGPRALGYIIGIAVGLTLLSFVPEMIWRKYV